jgi:glycosyltransferase involved in cell wall biosynthesis
MPSVRDFAVSVIIPVYNAETFLRKAIESAVNLEEVGEIILI